jgi:hypothetical protein
MLYCAALRCAVLCCDVMFSETCADLFHMDSSQIHTRAPETTTTQRQTYMCAHASSSSVCGGHVTRLPLFPRHSTRTSGVRRRLQNHRQLTLTLVHARQWLLRCNGLHASPSTCGPGSCWQMPPRWPRLQHQHQRQYQHRLPHTETHDLPCLSKAYDCLVVGD